MSVKTYLISYSSDCRNVSVIGSRNIRAISRPQALKIFNRDYIKTSTRRISNITIKVL